MKIYNDEKSIILQHKVDYQQEVTSYVLVLFCTFTFIYIYYDKQTRQKLKWVLQVLALLVIGLIGLIIHLHFLKRVDSLDGFVINYKNVWLSGTFNLFTVCIVISFTLFSFQYFQSTTAIKLIISNINDPTHMIKTKQLFTAIVSLMVACQFFIVLSISISDSKQYISETCRNTDCLGLQVFGNIIKTIQDLSSIVPLAWLGISLLRINKQRVVKSKSNSFVMIQHLACAVLFVSSALLSDFSMYVSTSFKQYFLMVQNGLLAMQVTLQCLIFIRFKNIQDSMIEIDEFDEQEQSLIRISVGDEEINVDWRSKDLSYEDSNNQSECNLSLVEPLSINQIEQQVMQKSIIGRKFSVNDPVITSFFNKI